MNFLKRLRQVREARASIGLRKIFMEALFPFFGRPLEADTVGYLDNAQSFILG